MTKYNYYILKEFPAFCLDINIITLKKPKAIFASIETLK